MPEEAERRGIGTPATRAATIEKLVQKGFLAREGGGKTKHLIPTEKGRGLIAAMPEQLKSPAMTAEWETKLTQIEKGQYAPEQFMEEIESMMKTLVNQYANVPPTLPPGPPAVRRWWALAPTAARRWPSGKRASSARAASAAL